MTILWKRSYFLGQDCVVKFVCYNKKMGNSQIYKNMFSSNAPEEEDEFEDASGDIIFQGRDLTQSNALISQIFESN